MKQEVETVQLDGAVPNKRFNGVNQHPDRFKRVRTMSSCDNVRGSVGIYPLLCPLLITLIKNNTNTPLKISRPTREIQDGCFERNQYPSK